MIDAREGSNGSSSAAFAGRALALALVVTVAFYAAAGLTEATLISVLQPTELELDWISDAVLSGALGIAVYLWLHLRATRRALTEHERTELVIQSQLSMAEAMQRRLLPPVPGPIDGFEWAALLTPAGRIGGDFFDFIDPAPGVRLTLIADISGKGISAAMALTLLRFTFRHVAHDTQSPADLTSRMSSALYGEWHGEPYVTCLIARVDLVGRTLTYTNAGHPPGILVRDRGNHELTEGGPPLGLLADSVYTEERLDLIEGDVCALVTDGVTEAFDDPSRPWRAVIADAVRNGRSAQAICNAVMSDAREGRGPRGVDDWTDDRTVVVIALDGKDRPSGQRRTS
ncbi:MAG TPA: PP2C family protein-serine/threonine phosphatase [Vicinamibacterales bacterium]